MDDDIYGRDKKLEYIIKRIKSSKMICEKDKKLLMEFKEACFSAGLSTARALYYMNWFWAIIKKFKIKSLSQMKEEDIKKLIADLTKSDYADKTKENLKIAIKKFFQWHESYEWNSREYPDKVKWIRINVKNNHRLPEDLLTEEDIKKMIENAENIRDRALISVLYESGCRIGEMLGLKLKHIEFNEYGVKITVYGKTGSRKILLINSMPYLSTWLENHPYKKDRESYLWVSLGTNFKGRLGYRATLKRIQGIAEKSKIEKHVNPHAFRHARATHLANKLTEAQMKAYFGWIQGSKMASVYVHLSGRDIDSAILEMHGMKEVDKEKEEATLKPKDCPRCEMKNPATAKMCCRCGLALDVQTAMEMENKLAELVNLINSPEIIEKLVERKVAQMLKDQAKNASIKG